MDSVILLLLLPSIGFIWILTQREEDRKQVMMKGQITTVVTLIEAMRLWSRYDTTGGYQFITKIDWTVDANLGEGAYIQFGLDGIGLVFVVLTALLMAIGIQISSKSIRYMEKGFVLSMIGMEVLLLGVFTVMDILGFYILFEGVLIPMYIIIGVYGSRSEKVGAAMYFFFYTLIGSVIMLIGIIYMYKTTGSTDYLVLLGYNFPREVQGWLFLALFASLAVKIPMWPFHIWLPQAHVEAPLAGSVILAGILIKLGSYGFIRFGLPILPEGAQLITPLIFTLGVIGIIYASLSTIRQTDMKRIIAYSSVGHMGVVMLGLFSGSVLGVAGSIFMQVGHGVVSSGLFMLVTMLYERHHTRLVKYYRGIVMTMPVYIATLFIFSLANMGAPLTSNFIGEITSLMAAYQISPIIGVLGSLGMILSAAYGLFMYNRIAYGAASKYLGAEVNRDITRREWDAMRPLLILTVVLGIAPVVIFRVIDASVVSLLGAA